MAKKKYGKRSKEAEDKPRPKESENKKLLKRILERSKLMIEADQDNRSAALADIKFVNEPGAQWDTNMKKEREGRPCLEANTLRINGKRIINEIRANRPQGHVRAVEGGDKEGAELREGLVRNILNVSDFDSITDYAAEYQVDGGLGAWRVATDYADDSMWDQDIEVEPIKNPFCLYWDPSCKDILQKRDAADWLLIDRIPVDEYEAKYKDAEKFDFTAEDDLAVEEWEDEETVRVAEYWYKEPYDKELWLIELPKTDGSGGVDRLTVDSTSDEAAALKAQGVVPVKTRLVHCHKVMMCVASGKSILKGPVEWGSPEFPFIVAHGEIKVIDGKVRWHGLHRHSKDAQQIQNVFWTAAAETVALAPKAYDWATTKQAEGNLDQWAEAHAKNIPVKIYNADPLAPGAPQRVPGAQIPAAMMEMVGLSGDLIRTTSGLHEASFGEESDEKSGVALARKQRQAQIVTYNFPDNMAKAAKRTGEIILSLIPVIYDAERELRILGVDGAEDYAKVNQIVLDPSQGKAIRVNDLTSGKYDYYVKSGPSFSSQREEASEIYGEFVQKFPELMGVAGDLIFKASELPYSDEIAERMQTLLPPPIQAQLAEDGAQAPEVKAAMAQVQSQAQMLQQQGQLVQQAAQEADEKVLKVKQAEAALKERAASMDVERANWQAEMTKREAALAIKAAEIHQQIAAKDVEQNAKDGDLKLRETKYKADKERDARDNKELGDTRQRVEDLDSMLAQYIQAFGQRLTQFNGEITKPKPKLKSAKIKRNGAKVIAEAEFDDGTRKTLEAARNEGGELVAVPVQDQPTVQ